MHNIAARTGWITSCGSNGATSHAMADAIVYAAEHPVRKIYAGGAAWAMVLPQRVGCA